MKLEKRSVGAPEEESAPQPETSSPGRKPVIMYIMILFIVAFLLMALSFFVHQRSNSEALGQLQSSFHAMQEVQSTQEKIIELQEELADAQDTIETMEDAAEAREEELELAQRTGQAYLNLLCLQQYYESGDYDACQKGIQSFEAAGYDALLPIETADGAISPHGYYLQLKAAVEEKLEDQAN